MSSAISTRAGRRRVAGSARAAKGKAPSGAEGGRAAPGAEASHGNGVRAWHLFVIAALAASSAGALLTQGTRPANIVFVCLAIFAAGTTGYGLYLVLWPLVSPDAGRGPEMVGGRTRAALEREKFQVLRAIKDLEFDRAMGKVAEPDFQEMVGRLRGRAMRLIRQLDAGAAGYRELIERDLGARLGQAARQPAAATVSEPDAPAAQPPTSSESSRPGATGEGAQPPDEDQAEWTAASTAAVGMRCPQCQTVNDADARFCKTCGTRLAVIA